MAGQSPIKLTLPPGRLLGGSLYEPNTKDAEGKPLTIKTGPNAGQPRVDYFILYAVPKTPGQAHWALSDWGKAFWQVGSTAFPQQSQRPDFAWKIIDGDSTIPNKAGKVPAQQEGYAGHWIIKISSGFQAPLFQAVNGVWTQQPQKDFAQPGDYLQAQVTISDNGSQQQPGIFVNHVQFAFLGHGTRIVSAGGADPNSAGFAMGHLPTGASATPAAAMPMPAAPGAAPMPPTPPGIPGLPPAPGAPAPIAPPPAPPAPPADPLVPVAGATHTPAQLRALGWSDDQIVAGGYATRATAAPLPPATSAPAPAAPAAPIAPALPVTPNPAFPQIPPAPAAPPAGPQLTSAGVAAGGSYENFRAQGWQDDQLRAAGYLA